MEFHGVNGNHGAGYNNAMNDKSRNIICLGYWNDIRDEVIINGKRNYGLPGENEALNPEVQKLFSYCVPNGYLNLENIKYSFPSSSKFNQQYSFERGGIRFVITGYDVTTNKERGEWLREELCKKHNSSTTIVLTHDPPFHSSSAPQFWNGLIDTLDCDHRVSAVLGGHVHTYYLTEYKNVRYMTVSGMFFGEIFPGHPLWNDEDPVPLSDHWIVNVYQNRLDFVRYLWNGAGFSSEGVQMSILGNFFDYIHPEDKSFSQELDLSAGYNFISFLGDSSMIVSEFVEIINENEKVFVSIAYFEEGKWKSYKINGGEFVGENFPIKSNKGYLLKVNQPVQISIDVHPSEIDVDEQGLEKGWSLFSIRNNTDVKDYLDNDCSRNDSCDAVCTYENYRFKCFLKEGNTYYGNNFLLEEGKSYFVRNN